MADSHLLLAERIFRLYTRGLSYPVLLQYAPQSVPSFIKEASSEAEFKADEEPRQKLSVRLGKSGSFEFVCYGIRAKNALLSGGRLTKTRIDVFHNRRLVCAALLEPQLTREGPNNTDDGAVPTGVADYQPGLWENLFEEWDKQLKN